MKAKAAVKAIIFFTVLALVISGLSFVLRKKDSWHYKYQFLHSAEDYDVLFFGSSHVHEGIDPIVLWEDYGIRSYNLASAGESVQITYYVVKEALSRCNPKVIFIDSFKITDGDSLDQKYAFVHESLDALPLNKNKLEAINYAAPLLEENSFSLISDLYAYHGRYGELTAKDFKNDYTRDKGAYIMTSIVPVEKPELSGTTEKAELKGGRGTEAYKKILELCAQRGIKCVLLSVPARNGMINEKHFNALEELTRENGGYTIEGNKIADEIGIDYAYDFGDAESHLNLLGAKKFTDYIGAFLQKEFGLTDLRQDKGSSEVWNADLRAWSEYKAEMLDDKEEAVAYLFGAYDPIYTVKVYVRDKALIDKQYGLTFCLETMGVEAEEAGDEELGSSAFDMRIRVMSADTGEQVKEQYFTFDEDRSIFRTDK